MTCSVPPQELYEAFSPGRSTHHAGPSVARCRRIEKEARDLHRRRLLFRGFALGLSTQNPRNPNGVQGVSLRGLRFGASIGLGSWEVFSSVEVQGLLAARRGEVDGFQRRVGPTSHVDDAEVAHALTRVQPSNIWRALWLRSVAAIL